LEGLNDLISRYSTMKDGVMTITNDIPWKNFIRSSRTGVVQPAGKIRETKANVEAMRALSLEDPGLTELVKGLAPTVALDIIESVKTKARNLTKSGNPTHPQALLAMRMSGEKVETMLDKKATDEFVIARRQLLAINKPDPTPDEVVAVAALVKRNGGKGIPANDVKAAVGMKVIDKEKAVPVTSTSRFARVLRKV